MAEAQRHLREEKARLAWLSTRWSLFVSVCDTHIWRNVNRSISGSLDSTAETAAMANPLTCGSTAPWRLRPQQSPQTFCRKKSTWGKDVTGEFISYGPDQRQYLRK
jgi:hypothetical protein